MLESLELLLGLQQIDLELAELTADGELLPERIQELEEEKESLQGRCRRLELPALDQEMLGGLIENFEAVLAEGSNQNRGIWWRN